MRLHHLTVTGFGPFPGTIAVDFDELNDAGVFLVTGPTGAGKTSLLDAVCFALYGVVPGVRDVRTLRSHHVAPDVRPEVVLEATIGQRRLRVTRSPEWLRPKKRGEGTTKENARAGLIDLTDGTERLLSSRAQEVGHELGLLLGMSSDQFMQVVLLPQGEFQRFLRATSDQRQEVLQRLFGTQRFVQIETWMQERSRELSHRAEQRGRRVAQLLATLSHRSGIALPESLAADPLDDVAALARSWAAEAVAVVEQAGDEARRRETACQEATEEAETVLGEASRRAAAAGRRASAIGRLARLAASEGEAQAAVEQLRRHERALPVRPHLDPLTSLQAAHEVAAGAVVSASAAARRDPAVLGSIDPPSLTSGGGASRWGSSCTECRGTRNALLERLAALRAAVPRQQAAARAAQQLSRATTALASVDDELADLEERAARLPALLAAADTRLQQLRLVAAQGPTAAADLERAEARHRAAVAAPEAVERHAALLDRWRTARDRAADARHHHLTLLERRLTGIAAELAGQLVEGVPCQVCGGCDHPSPARPTSAAVTEEEQAQAEQESAEAAEAAEHLGTEVQASAQHVAELQRRADGTRAAAEQCLAAARETLTGARAAATALLDLERERATLQEESDGLAARRAVLHRRQASLTAEMAAASQRLSEARAEVAAVVGAAGVDREPDHDPDHEPDHDPGDDVLPALVAQHEHGLRLVDALVEQLEERDRLAERLAAATTLAEKVAAEQGFASVDEAAQALLPGREATILVASIRAREDERRAADAALADEEVRRLDQLEEAGAEQVDPGEAAGRLDAARRELREASAAAGRCAAAADAARALVTDLHGALEAWEPARRQHLTVKGVAELVRGRGPDNQLRMRLSSFVLATRLDQVLDAANARLSEMRDQRYSLRRTGEARGGTRAGLDIEVLDAWTGESRSPTTLSGGETFVVSLALALGLADVVSEESGGLPVDTLFVDEGFGSLDADTLDDVMDRLDALRAGGRTVGVVSHVSEMRTRIPVQLHVTRTRQGSSVRLRTLTG